MSSRFSPWRVAFGLWMALLPLLVLLMLWPVNSRSLRLGFLIAGVGFILGSLVFSWRRKGIFFAVLGVLIVIGGVFLAPGRPQKIMPDLQARYVEEMIAYEGVPYVWGGENRNGMDCSGLVRKGLQNAMWKEGVLAFNPFLLRGALDLWWNDTTASEIGRGYDGRTWYVTTCDFLNSLDPDVLQPGDMAVTTSGIHVMAYLGDGKWIGADPGEMKVTIFQVPDTQNAWFSSSMNIIRWK